MLAYYNTLAPDSISAAQLDMRLALGWYRMHQTIFSATHWFTDDLRRVHWLRLPLTEIVDRAAHRRIRKRNQSFRVTIDDLTSIRSDHEELYARYRKSIDFDGALTVHHALFGEANGGQSIFSTRYISVFDGDKLIAGGYFDLGDIAAASILHFFDPEYKRYSLGKYLVLITVDFIKSSGYTFYYPGYVIAGNPKMDYKLFLGKEATQYFEPEGKQWKPYNESILVSEENSDVERMDVFFALLESRKP